MRELAVGENVVWGLSYDKGRLCRLIGLSRSNPTGIYWKTSEIRLKLVFLFGFSFRTFFELFFIFQYCGDIQDCREKWKGIKPDTKMVV